MKPIKPPGAPTSPPAQPLALPKREKPTAERTTGSHRVAEQFDGKAQPSGPHQPVTVSADPGSLQDLGKRSGQVFETRQVERAGRAPVPLVDVPMPDPFVWARHTTDAKGNAITGDWLTATSNHWAETFPLFKKDEVTGQWQRAVDAEGKPMAIFSAEERPTWIHKTEPDRWAPEIHVIDGKEVALYTARHQDGDLVLASAVNENGKWVDHGPLLRLPHGVIDATVTHDPRTGDLVMLYKPDNNSVGEPTPIVAQKAKLGAKGLELVGEPHTLMVSGPDDGGLIEGPFVVHENGTNWVFVASDNFATRNYKTWFSSVDDLQHGTATPHELLISSESKSLRGEWVGPGHAMLKKVEGADGLYKLYLHVWKNGTDGKHQFQNRFIPGDDSRKVIELTVSFRDEAGRPTKPYVVEDRIGGDEKGLGQGRA